MTDIRPLDYLRAILDDPDLTSSERLVALAIMRHAGATGRKSHPGVKKLVDETHLNKKTVTTACRHLEEKKWLILTYSGKGGDHGKSNEYDLNIPSDSQGSSNGSLGEESQGSSFTSQGSPFSSQGSPNGSTDAFGNAPGDAPHHRADGESPPSGETPSPGSGEDGGLGLDEDDAGSEGPGLVAALRATTPGQVASALREIFPSWGVRVPLFTKQVKAVDQDLAVPAGIVGQAITWWIAPNFVEGKDWPLPPGLLLPDNIGNPAGWLHDVLPDLVSAYVEASAKQASELGVPPDSFCFVSWLAENYVSAAARAEHDREAKAAEAEADRARRQEEFRRKQEQEKEAEEQRIRQSYISRLQDQAPLFRAVPAVQAVLAQPAVAAYSVKDEQEKEIRLALERFADAETVTLDALRYAYAVMFKYVRHHEAHQEALALAADRRHYLWRCAAAGWEETKAARKLADTRPDAPSPEYIYLTAQENASARKMLRHRWVSLADFAKIVPEELLPDGYDPGPSKPPGRRRASR